MRAAWLGIVAPVFVAGCGDSDNATISIDAGSSGESEQSDKGKFSIKAEGFNLDLDIPKIALENSNVDINGLGLYPDATVNGITIDTAKENSSKNRVKIGFSTPDTADRVLTWYNAKMKQRGYAPVRGDNRLSGTNEDGEDVEIRARDLSDGGSQGTISIRDTR